LGVQPGRRYLRRCVRRRRVAGPPYAVRPCAVPGRGVAGTAAGHPGGLGPPRRSSADHSRRRGGVSEAMQRRPTASARC